MIEGIYLWVGIAVGACVILGYVVAAAVFMVKMSSMPKDLQEFKQDIGTDVSLIKSDVHATRDDISRMRTDIEVMKTQIEADHSSVNRFRDVDLAELRQQLESVRNQRREGKRA